MSEDRHVTHFVGSDGWVTTIKEWFNKTGSYYILFKSVSMYRRSVK